MQNLAEMDHANPLSRTESKWKMNDKLVTHIAEIFIFGGAGVMLIRAGMRKVDPQEKDTFIKGPQQRQLANRAMFIGGCVFVSYAAGYAIFLLVRQMG